ncbi:hypothetical protein [Paraburkholderia sp. BR14374]|uniref:hypothetical protein n=1 Tax=Paraburkholderia sp. BR14374 TaxID=3237007 RepID=UPI0034CDDE3C
MPQLSFDGQAAIVTGAAGAIGRAIATELALRGARIVVNDYGGDTAGADCNPVGTTESARAIVDTPMRAFGRVDGFSWPPRHAILLMAP